MQTKLTFEQYREKFIPNWRYYPCNGWNDPNEGWYYAYRNSPYFIEKPAPSEEEIKQEQARKQEQEKFENYVKNELEKIEQLDLQSILKFALGNNWENIIRKEIIEKLKVRYYI